MSLSKYAPPEAAKVVRALIKAALDKGWSVSVYDTEEFTLEKSTEPTTIFEALATTWADTIYFHDGDEEKGWVSLIYENYGDVISDHVDNPAMYWLTKTAIGE